MAVSGLFRSGKNAYSTVENVVLRKSKWDVDLKGDDLDGTNFDSGGVDEGFIGIVGIDWNLGGLWDSSLDALADPPGLYPRDNLGTVILGINASDAYYWNLPANRVLSSKNGAEVRQAVTFDSSGKINGGPFYMPGDIPWVSETD